MDASISGLLHGGLVPGHGPLAALGDLAIFMAFILTILGLVVLFEDTGSNSDRLRWGAIILFLPVAGPIWYLVRR
jgi:uncharacterized membrane protein